MHRAKWRKLLALRWTTILIVPGDFSPPRSIGGGSGPDTGAKIGIGVCVPTAVILSALIAQKYLNRQIRNRLARGFGSGLRIHRAVSLSFFIPFLVLLPSAQSSFHATLGLCTALSPCLFPSLFDVLLAVCFFLCVRLYGHIPFPFAFACPHSSLCALLGFARTFAIQLQHVGNVHSITCSNFRRHWMPHS